MRSLIGFLALLVVLLVAAAIAVPAIVKPMVVSAVRTGSPFAGQALDVQVDLDAVDLLRGVIGEIHVTGSHLERGGVTIAHLDVTATDVRIGDHPVASIEGSLVGVDVLLDDGATLRMSSIGVTGPSNELEAVAHLDAGQATAFVQHAFDEEGVSVGEIQLADGGVSFVVFEQRVTVPLGVEDGALVIPDLLGAGPLEVLAPIEGDPWRIVGVSVTPGGLDLTAVADVAGLLAGG